MSGWTRPGKMGLASNSGGAAATKLARAAILQCRETWRQYLRRLLLGVADAHARKEHTAIRSVDPKAFGFPLAATLGARTVAALWDETVSSLFDLEFAGAKLPLLVLLACQLVRVLFGLNVVLLSVVGAQRQSAMLAVGALIVLALTNLALVPSVGVVGAAVALATIVWLSARVAARVSGLKTDALHLVFRMSPKSKLPR